MKFTSSSLSPVGKCKTNQAVEELRVFLRTMCVAQRRWARDIATFESHVRKRMIEEDHCRERLRRVVLRGAYDQLKYLGTTDLLSCAEAGVGSSSRRLLVHRLRPEIFLLYDIAPAQITPFSVYAMSRLRSNPSRLDRDLFFYSSSSLIAEYQAGWAMLSPIVREQYEDLAELLRSSVAKLWKTYGLEKMEVENTAERVGSETKKRVMQNTKIRKEIVKWDASAKGISPAHRMITGGLKVLCTPSSVDKNKRKRKVTEIAQFKSRSQCAPSSFTGNSACTRLTERVVRATLRKRERNRNAFMVGLLAMRNGSIGIDEIETKRPDRRKTLKKIARKISRRLQWVNESASVSSSLSPGLRIPSSTPPLISGIDDALTTPIISQTASKAEGRSTLTYPAFSDLVSPEKCGNQKHKSFASSNSKNECDPLALSVASQEHQKLFENFLRSTMVQLKSSLGRKNCVTVGKGKETQLTVKRWLPIALREWNTLTPEQKQLY